MHPLIIGGLISWSVNLAIGLFVFFNNPKKRVNRNFTSFNICIGCWSSGSFFLNIIPDKDIAIWILRASYLFAILLLPAFLYFVYSILQELVNKKVMLISWLCSLFLIITLPTQWFIKGIYILPKDELLISLPGPTYYIYIVEFAITAYYGFSKLISAIRLSKGIKRNQLKYVFLAYFIAFLAGLDYFMSVFKIFKGFPIDDYILVLPFLILAYAIIHYRLMDINIAIKKLITNFILTIIITIGIICIIVLPTTMAIKSLISVILGILLTAYLPEIKYRTESTVNHILYKEKYKYQDKLEEYTEDILGIHKEDDLFNITAKTLSETLDVRKVGIFTVDNVSGDYILKTGIGLEKQEESKIFGNAGIAVWLKKNKVVFVKEEMEKVLEHTELGPIRETLANLEATVCVPVLFENELVGIIILGEKSSGDMYSHVDTEILHHIGTQLAFALNYRRKEEELRREKELANIGIMTAEISHQLRNLLVSPRTFIDLAPQRRDDDEFFGDFRKLAEAQIAKLDEKLEYISLFGRSVKLKYASIDINQVLENILTEYGDMFKDIIAVKEFSGLPLVRCDGEQVKLIFGNIIINSIEAMQDKPGGKLRVRTRINENPAPEMKSLAERWIRTEIKDDGPGMNEEMYKKLFTPFVTTKSVGGVKEKGAGLGLAIAKKIVDLHKGVIDIRSSEGKGTTAIIDLPVQLKEEPKPPAEEMDAGMPPWLKGI